MGLESLLRNLLNAPSEAAVQLPEGLRYRAFLSYRTADAAQAMWLHRALEGYRVPRSLVGKPGAYGPVPARVGRIFRDRDDGRTVDDIETLVAYKLKRSEQLVVLCTPDVVSPGSWVPREIELFHQLRPGARVHAVIGRGNPPDIFPPPLRRVKPEGRNTEPLAADLRPRRGGGQDGRRRAVVKIVASMLGVEFDQLWRREVARTRQLVAWVIAAACASGAVAGHYIYGASLQEGNVLASLANEARSRGERVLALRLAIAALPPPGVSSWLSPTAPAAETSLRRALSSLPLLRAYGDVDRPVTSVAISARGERVAIASATGAAFLLNQDGEVLRRIPPAVNGAMASQVDVALARDGSLLAISEGFGRLRTFDRDGKPIAAADHFITAPVGLSNLSVLPDRSILAVRMGKILLLDPSTAQVIREWQIQEGAIFGVDISSAGHHVMTCSSNGTAVVWSLPEGDKVRELKPHAGEILQCGLSQDGTRAFTAAADGLVRVESVLDESIFYEWRGPAGTLTKGVFDPSGATLVLGSADGAVLVWQFGEDKRPRRVPGNGGPIRFLCVTRGGTQLVAVSQEGQLNAWDTTEYHREVAVQAHDGDVERVGATADCSQILSTGSDNSPKLWTTTSAARPLQQLVANERAEVEAASLPDGGRIGTLSARHQWLVRLLGRDPSQVMPPAPGRADEVRYVEISPDLTLALVMRGRVGEVQTASGEVLARLAPVPPGLRTDNGQREAPSFPQPPLPFSAADATSSGRGRALPLAPMPRTLRADGEWHLLSAKFSPNGKRIVGMSTDHHDAVVWDSATGQLLSRLTDVSGASTPLFSSDGSLLAGVSVNGIPTVWNSTTGKVVNEFNVPVVQGGQVSFSPDASWVAVPGPQTTRVLRRWDGALVTELQGVAHSFSLSPDGAYIAGITFNKIRLWRIEGGHELADFAVPGGGYTVMGFTASGKHLAAANTAGVWAWDIRQQIDPDTIGLRHYTCTEVLRRVPAFSEREVTASGVLVNRHDLWDPCDRFGPLDVRRYTSRGKVAERNIRDDSVYRAVPIR